VGRPHTPHTSLCHAHCAPSLNLSSRSSSHTGGEADSLMAPHLLPLTPRRARTLPCLRLPTTPALCLHCRLLYRAAACAAAHNARRWPARLLRQHRCADAHNALYMPICAHACMPRKPPLHLRTPRWRAGRTFSSLTPLIVWTSPALPAGLLSSVRCSAGITEEEERAGGI